MRTAQVILPSLILLAPVLAAALTRIFPFKYFVDDLRNGLRLVTVPTEYPTLVALYIVVRTGSRNEVEQGKSGFAHLFEHLMFRGTERFGSEQYDQILKNAGADHNAYTTDDRTVYHTVFSNEDLDQIMMLEADRFQNLKVPVELFKTEASAVLGEYNKNASNPLNKLVEVLRDTAFESHTYKHTTMGFIADVENMPNMYNYSIEFFNRYYRPEYTTIILAGDVTRETAMSLTDKYWGGWRRGSFEPLIPVEPEQKEERTASVDWPVPTLPWLAVAYKGAAYSDEQKDMAAMDLISSIGFSESSDLYQQLVVKEQKVDVLFPSSDDHRDPYLVLAAARVKDSKDIDYVKNETIKTYESFKSEKVSRQRLEDVKSNLRYAFALSLDNSEKIASSLAAYLGLKSTPETINRLYDVYASITPEDIQSMANRYFVATGRTVVTLQHKESD
jgi:zinc protease